MRRIGSMFLSFLVFCACIAAALVVIGTPVTNDFEYEENISFASLVETVLQPELEAR